MDTQQHLPVAIIGAGPVGLAAAAHLLERGLEPILFEAGDRAGAGIARWRHVRMFSPWRYDVDRAAARLLEPHGWQAPAADDLPTGGELLDRYLAPLAALPAIAGRLHTGSLVVAVGRHRLDKMKDAGRSEAPFSLQVRGPDGATRRVLARAVIDTSGVRASPLGADGLEAIGEAEAQDRIFAGIPDVRGGERTRYAGRRTAVVGAGHSALNALLDLVALADEVPATTAVWLLRRGDPATAYGGGAADALPARGALGARLRAAVETGVVEVEAGFRLEAIEREGGALRLRGSRNGAAVELAPVDEVIGATGGRPDLRPLAELRLALDPALESAAALGPLIDPNVHSCGTVRPHGEAELRHPERGFYIAGVKSYGRAPTFLLATGYEQVRSIAAAIAGDELAARAVELDLPETGVCGIGSVGGCCAAKADATIDDEAEAEVIAGQPATCCNPAGPAELAAGRCCRPLDTVPAGAPCCDAPPTAEARSSCCAAA